MEKTVELALEKEGRQHGIARLEDALSRFF